LITEEKPEPFCSSAIRSLTGVLALKNFAQLVSIAEMAPVPLGGSEDPVAGAELDDEDDEDGAVGAFGVLLDELPLLHPASATPTLSSSTADITPVSRKRKGCIAVFCRRTAQPKIMR
jgi:hypothetical protein